MASKTYAVLGLGRFGGAIARELSNSGYDVIAVDMNEELVKKVSMKVSYAVVADVADINAMREIGLGEVDAAFVSIGEDLESSILAAMVLKELGVNKIFAKASSEMHGKVLSKVGVTRVIFPEKEMGKRLAKNVVAGNFLDMIDLSNEYSLVEVNVPKHWVNRDLMSINVRRNYGINVVAIKSEKGDIMVNIDPNYVFCDGDVIVVVGDNHSISKLGD